MVEGPHVNGRPGSVPATAIQIGKARKPPDPAVRARTVRAGSGRFEQVGWAEALDETRDGGDRALRPASGDAAEPFGPARHAVVGQHVAALLIGSARAGSIAGPCAAGVRSEAWATGATAVLTG